MGNRGRKLCIAGVFLIFAIILVGTAASNASGAPANAAKDGCSCHGPVSAEATVGIVAPATYEAGQTYDVKVTVTGPMAIPPPVGQNSGGFALEVSAGTLAGTGGVRAEGQFATHSATGNDQRSWDVKWTAPTSSAEVTFYASANAVNGDGQMIQDRWNKAVAVVKPVAAANTTSAVESSPTTSSPTSEGSPSLSMVLVVAVLAALALVRRRL